MRLIPPLLFVCSVAFVVPPATALPLAPPEPSELEPQQAFFRALSKRLPIADLPALARHVAPDLKVYSDGVLTYANRDEWFSYLQSFGPARPDGPQGVTVNREEFYATKDGAIIALEFSWPIPPKGKEGQISYHQDYDLQLVSYRLDNGILTRVDYGKRMRRYDQYLKDENPGIPRSR